MKTLAILLLPLLLAGPVLADGDGDHDHDRARRALEAGDVLPLTTLLARSGVEQSGRLIEVELEHDDDRLIYELKVLTPQGRVAESHYDARTGDLLTRKGDHR